MSKKKVAPIQHLPETTAENRPTKVKGLVVECMRLRDEEIWKVPDRQYPADAGLDITVCRHVTVQGKSRVQVATNLAVAIPPGYFGLVLPRSSTFHRRGLIIHPGMIDSGYRGEVMILAYNPGERGVFIQEGERIAQMVILPVVPATFSSQKKLTAGERDEQGFGSTGGFAGDPDMGGMK